MAGTEGPNNYVNYLLKMYRELICCLHNQHDFPDEYSTLESMQMESSLHELKGPSGSKSQKKDHVVHSQKAPAKQKGTYFAKKIQMHHTRCIHQSMFEQLCNSMVIRITLEVYV